MIDLSKLRALRHRARRQKEPVGKLNRIMATAVRAWRTENAVAREEAAQNRRDRNARRNEIFRGLPP